MKDAVVFAWYMPRIERINYYLEILKQYYSDCDIFLGINPNSNMDCLPILDQSGLNIYYEIVGEHIKDENDNGGFQTSLKLLLNSKQDYFLVHFLYNKGISYADERNFHISFNDYFVRYAEKISLFRKILINNPKYGGCAVQGEMNPDTNERYSYLIDKFHKFDFDAMNYNWLIQIYNMRWEILKPFLSDCGDFLNDSIRSFYEPVRNQSHEIANFFEYVFPQIIDRSGYFRYTEDLWPQRYDPINKKLNYNDELKFWQKKNRLELIETHNFKTTL